MRLLECDGKALLARHGIGVPAGGLWPDLPGNLDGRLAVKAQVLAGGRGKRGGVRFVEGRREVGPVARALLAAPLGSEEVQAVYVEERLAVRHELYLAALIDRDAGMPVLLASAEGGVDIEAVAPAKIVRQPVDPLLGLRPFMLASLVRPLGVEDRLGAAVSAVAERLYRALLAEDAQVIEINPLVVTAAGDLVAADAKVVLDEDAFYRHPGLDRRLRTTEGSRFERRARELEVIGIELDGDIAAIMSGAGLTMATLDQIAAHGGSVRALVELHGALRWGPARVAEIIELLADLEPTVLLVNAYFQLQRTDTLAEGVALALDRLPPERKRFERVIRLRGVGQERAHALLAGHDCVFTLDFDDACRQAAALARTGR
jgi:succinyl-CoA synthetase beta subunit